MYGVTNYFRLRFRLPYRVTNGNVIYFEVFINNIPKDYCKKDYLKWEKSGILSILFRRVFIEQFS